CRWILKSVRDGPVDLLRAAAGACSCHYLHGLDRDLSDPEHPRFFRPNRGPPPPGLGCGGLDSSHGCAGFRRDACDGPTWPGSFLFSSVTIPRFRSALGSHIRRTDRLSDRPETADRVASTTASMRHGDVNGPRVRTS